MVARTSDERLAQAELDALWSHVPIGVVLVDAETEQVVRANAIARGLGVGVDLPRILDVPGDDGAAGEARAWPITRTLRDGETVHREKLVVETAAGSTKTVSVTTVPIRADGRVVTALVLIEDVSDAVVSDSAARDFITNAAHELQTPIAAIVSAVDVLQAGAKDRRDDRERFLAHIEASTTRLRGLIRALLVLAQAQARVGDVRTEVVELEPLLRTVADATDADVAIECEPRVAAVANRALLEHAIGSLVDNALKHAGGPVAVEARVVGGRAVITVSDAGGGIAPGERSRVFDRFYRADRSHDGFGLGLAIVREIVDVLEGDVEIESSESGTRVSIAVHGARVRST